MNYRGNALRVLALTALGVVGLLFSSHLRADVAAPRADGSGIIQLYYVSAQGTILRGDCNVATTIYNRANCTTNMTEMAMQLFYGELLKTYGGQAEAMETKVIEGYAKIQDIDRKLLEFITVNPSPNPRQGADILDQIKAAEADLSSKILVQEQLKDQLARVKEALGLNPASSDLQSQFTLLTRDLALATLSLDIDRQNLAALNRSYVELNSGLISTDQFEVLSRQRESLVATLVRNQDQHATLLNWRKEAARSINMLQDHTFVYEPGRPANRVPDVYFVVQGYGTCMDHVTESMRRPEFVRDQANPMLVNLDVPYDLMVEKVDCSFNSGILIECTEPRLQVTSGLGTSTIFNDDFILLSNSDPNGRPDSRFVGRSAKGHWEIQLLCNGGPSPYARFMEVFCNLQLKPFP